MFLFCVPESIFVQAIVYKIYLHPLDVRYVFMVEQKIFLKKKEKFCGIGPGFEKNKMFFVVLLAM